MKERVDTEALLLPEMVKICCHGTHKMKKGELCDSCKKLTAYSLARLAHCKFGNNKTFCSQCPIHCYKPEMRARIKEVMRYSGPRLMFTHPVMAVRHLSETVKGKIKKKRG